MPAIDVLYIVLTFSVLWISAAICFLVWQVAKVIKNVNEGIGDLRTSIVKIERALTAIKMRFEHATSNFSGVVNGLGKVVEFAMDRKDRKKDKKKDRDTDYDEFSQ